MLTIYGIKNCDTMKKAMTWLNDQHIAFRFHDYKKDGLPDALLDGWLDTPGWDALINFKGTTWRKLGLDKATLTRANACALIQANPSLIRRPLLDIGTELLIGFDAPAWAHALQKT